MAPRQRLARRRLPKGGRAPGARRRQVHWHLCGPLQLQEQQGLPDSPVRPVPLTPRGQGVVGPAPPSAPAWPPGLPPFVGPLRPVAAPPGRHAVHAAVAARSPSLPVDSGTRAQERLVHTAFFSGRRHHRRLHRGGPACSCEDAGAVAVGRRPRLLPPFHGGGDGGAARGFCRPAEVRFWVLRLPSSRPIGVEFSSPVRAARLTHLNVHCLLPTVRYEAVDKSRFQLPGIDDSPSDNLLSWRRL